MHRILGDNISVQRYLDLDLGIYHFGFGSVHEQGSSEWWIKHEVNDVWTCLCQSGCANPYKFTRDPFSRREKGLYRGVRNRLHLRSMAVMDV